MKKNILYAIIGLIVLAGFLSGAYVITGGSGQDKPVAKNVKPTNEIILYWGIGCPHCQILEEYLKAHPNIEKKIKIDRKEVFQNQTNAADMEQKAESCKVDTSQGIGVPFMYYKGRCLSGDQPIIDFLTKQAT